MENVPSQRSSWSIEQLSYDYNSRLALGLMTLNQVIKQKYRIVTFNSSVNIVGIDFASQVKTGDADSYLIEFDSCDGKSLLIDNSYVDNDGVFLSTVSYMQTVIRNSQFNVTNSLSLVYNDL